MPDHVHALLSFSPIPGMRKTMNDWKRYTASALGIEWQRDFFDHRLRHDESFVQKAHYIRMNPVRAKRVETSEDWPYVWTANGDFGETALPPLASHQETFIR
jgi:REP element-mobilizing transposase RayT